MREPMVSVGIIEQYMRTAHDIKKEFAYSKALDKWFWYDRGEEHDTLNWVGPFDNFWVCLGDAIGPYITEGT